MFNKTRVMLINAITYEALAVFFIFSLGISNIIAIVIMSLIFPVFFAVDWFFKKRRKS